MINNLSLKGLEPDAIHPRALAHLGDSVYEVVVRQLALVHCAQQVEALHEFTTRRVQAGFQVGVLRALEPELNEGELDIVRRARNLPTPASRRKNQSLHRHATGFEALVGYLYLKDTSRFEALMDKVMAGLIAGVYTESLQTPEPDEG